MAIIKRVTERMFVDDMMEQGFTAEAAEKLYAWYDDMEDSVVYHDPVAFRCEWSEYKSVYELYDEQSIVIDRYLNADDYRAVDEEEGDLVWDADKEDEFIEKVADILEKYTIVLVSSENCILVAEF